MHSPAVCLVWKKCGSPMGVHCCGKMWEEKTGLNGDKTFSISLPYSSMFYVYTFETYISNGFVCNYN